MSTSTGNFLQNAKSNLKKVDTRDETKEHDYLGRVIGEHETSRMRESPAGTYMRKPIQETKYIQKKTIGGELGSGTLRGDQPGVTETIVKEQIVTTGDVGTTGATVGGIERTGKYMGLGTSGSGKLVGTTGMTSAGGVVVSDIQEEYVSISDQDIREQLRIIDQDIANLMKKLRLSEDRIHIHRLRKEQNLGIQRDVGIKASEMRTLAEQKNEEKNRVLEEEYQLERRRADLHQNALDLEMERARSIATERTNLDLQRIALQRAEEHERGIQYGQALKERYEYQMNILQTQKQLLEFESRMKNVLSLSPPLNFGPVDVRNEVAPEVVEERRIIQESVYREAGRTTVVTGHFDGESTMLGESDAPLGDIKYYVKLLP